MILPAFSQQDDTKQKETKEKESKTEKVKKKESEKAEELSNVSVQGTSKAKKIETSGFAVSIISTKEASLRNLTTNELLDRSVGVRVRQNGGLGANVEYNLNGMSGSTIGIFIDGIEASTFGQSFNLNNIPPSMIERIEVYKGILPSHLTGDYVGGAINVVLKKDVSQNNATAAVSYGSFNTFQSDLSGTYRDKKTGLSFRGSGFYTYTDNSYETWGRSSTYVGQGGEIIRYYRAKRFNNDYRSIGGRFEAGFTDTKWADQFFIGYNGSSSYTEIPHGTTMAVPYVGRFNETKAQAFLLNYNKKNFLIKDLALNVNAVRSHRTTYVQDTVGLAYNWDGTVRTRPTYVLIYDENGQPIIKRDANGNIIYTDNTNTTPEYEDKLVHVPLATLQGGQQGKKTITNTDRKITNARSNLGYMITNGHRLSLNHKYEATERKDEDLLNPAYNDLATNSTVIKNIISMNYEAETFNRKLRTNILGKYTTNKTKQSKSEIVTVGGVNSLVKKDTTTTDYNFGYGATVSYNVITKLFIIASTENSFIMPTENQLYGTPENNILENLQLQPEKFINYNLGFRWGPSDLGKHRISLYANAFWRNGYNKITQQTVDATDPNFKEENADIQTTRYINLGRTQARGFEAEIIYVYNNRLNTSLNFSKFNNVFKQEFDSTGKPHTFFGQQVPNEPYFTVNANCQYRFNDVFQKKSVLNAYYTLGYIGEYYIVWGQPDWSLTPTQISHDLGASYRFPSGKLVASLDVKNLLNAELYDNFQIQKPGRGIYFKLNYTFSKFL
ncbi:TonB-dependent receptor [Flavobacterium limi]|uniref:TonB-dependent receptor n=2 Tax=Flavobacterium limi TaxID=2045105 RepID=A0ABQ1TPT4_9FLAO|nr:TonB-dependent receptor [Flavobacterium limi]